MAELNGSQKPFGGLFIPPALSLTDSTQRRRQPAERHNAHASPPLISLRSVGLLLVCLNPDLLFLNRDAMKAAFFKELL